MKSQGWVIRADWEGLAADTLAEYQYQAWRRLPVVARNQPAVSAVMLWCCGAVVLWCCG
ncbi:MAG: hypothetical protein ACKVN9_01525 [Methylophilaceae bacterium]